MKGGIYTVACVYGDHVITVYVSHKPAKAKAVRDKLREEYGTAARFHLTGTHMPPRFWIETQEKIRAELGLPPLATAPAEAETSEPEASA